MFMIHAPRWLAAGIYLGMGWLAVFGLQEALRVFPSGALVWLLLGGVVYTIGAVVYITKIMDYAPGVFGYHETWHIFVMLASLCHYLAVLIYVAPPGTAT
jgi:hemolysin III